MENEKSILQTIVDMMMGGKKTETLRKPVMTAPQDNTMVKVAAEEAQKRAIERGQMAPLDPGAAAILRKKR